MNRREMIDRFKHVILLVAAILFGMVVAKGSSTPRLDLLDAYTQKLIESGEKKIFVDSERTIPTKTFDSQGVPWVSTDVCAYTKEVNGELKVNVYCNAPCEEFCPVNPKAIRIRSNTDGSENPVVDYNLCINCGLCFKNCGYNAIEWINSGKVIQT